MDAGLNFLLFSVGSGRAMAFGMAHVCMYEGNKRDGHG